MSEEKTNYAVMDIKEKEFISKILITLDEAIKFKELSRNEDARVVYFGWHVINYEAEE